jgi:hypothetical protein
MRWPSSTVDAYGCDGRDRKTARNTNTCAVRIAPRPLLDWVEQDSPIGHAHARRRSLKKTDINPEQDRVKDDARKKTNDEEDALSHRPKKTKFGSALTDVRMRLRCDR